jgi:MFS superfamily sulfate permease-like transporter
MQACPQCGRREGIDLPAVILAVGFFALYCLWMMYSDRVPMSARNVGFGIFLAVMSTIGWISFRNRKRRREHEMLHPRD